MEGSRALSRCLQQLSIHNQPCLRTRTVTTPATRRLRAQRNSSRQTTQSLSSSRSFSTAYRTLQDTPSSGSQDARRTTSSSQAQPSSSSSSSTTQQPRSSPLGARASRSIDLSSLVKDPDYKAPIRRQSSTQQPAQGTSTTTAGTKPDAAAAQKSENARKIHSQLDAIVAEQRQRQANISQRRQQQSNYDAYGSGSTLFNQTRTPTRPAGPTPSTSDLAASMKSWVDSPIDPIDQKLLEETRELARAREQLRLHPSLGKTVDVNNESGFNVTRAFITLEARINGRGNAVRREEREQKFHIRKGQKRKLKTRERWRIVFKDGFLGECARVRKMIRQGW